LNNWQYLSKARWCSVSRVSAQLFCTRSRTLRSRG